MRLFPFAFLLFSCAPSIYVQKQDSALAIYDEAAKEIFDSYSAGSLSAINKSTTVLQANQSLEILRLYYSPAFWALFAVQRIVDHKGIDLVPSVCSLVFIVNQLGIPLDAGALCKLPMCYPANVPDSSPNDKLHNPLSCELKHYAP